MLQIFFVKLNTLLCYTNSQNSEDYIQYLISLYHNTKMNKNILLLFVILSTVCQPQYVYVHDAGCASLNVNSKCMACKEQSLLSICLPFYQLCKDYSLVDGSCLTCVPGFTQGQCHPSKMLEVYLNQANCVFFIKSIQLCLICNKGYKILDRACIHLNPNCDLYSPDGECRKCVSGYTLNKTICIEIIPALYIDVNCKNNHKSKCIECKDGYLLTKQAACVKNKLIVAKYDINAISAIYEPGSQLDAGKSQHKQQIFSFINDRNIVMSYDPLCSIFQRGVCIKCSYGAFFNTKGVCKLSNPLCKQSDTNGACISCYSDFQFKDGLCILISIQNLEKITDCYIGYALFQGQCIENQKFKQLNGYDINCKQYDDTGNCIDCSQRYFIKNRTCLEVSLYCKTFNPINGHCLSCYNGYRLGELGLCILKN